MAAMLLRLRRAAPSFAHTVALTAVAGGVAGAGASALAYDDDENPFAPGYSPAPQNAAAPASAAAADDGPGPSPWSKAYSAPAKPIMAVTGDDNAYLTSMIACSTECVTLSKDLILANPTTLLREFAEECIDDCAGDIELMKTWIAAPPEQYEDPDDATDLTVQAAAQIQLNRNRLRLIAPI